MTYVPSALILLRGFAGPLLLWVALTRQPSFWIVGILTFAFLSDVFDGVLARRLKCVTPELRVADSWVDTLFYLCVSAAVWRIHRPLLAAALPPIVGVLAFMGLNWMVAMIKFQRPLSFHAWSSKIWGLSLFALSVSLLGFSYGGVFLWLAIAIGLAGHLEGFVMTLILPNWAHDISGIPAAMRLRADAERQSP